MTAGRACGDLVFPVPFSPELHFSEFNSVLADMKNSVQVRKIQRATRYLLPKYN